jgi:hypothetical protein
MLMKRSLFQIVKASKPKPHIYGVIGSVLGLAGVASAAPFVNVQVLGSTSSVGPFAPSVNANPGTTVFYEVVAEINQSAVSNVTKFSNYTYTLNQPQNANDGMNSLGFNLLNSDSTSTLAAPALAPGWNQGTGASPGTISGQSVNGVFAVQSPGTVAGGTTVVQVLTGSLTAGSAANDLLSAAFDTNSNSGFTASSTGVRAAHPDITGDNGFLISSDTGDPVINYAPLTVTTASTPEPASVGLFMLAAGGLLIRRRRTINSMRGKASSGNRLDQLAARVKTTSVAP